MLAMENVEEKSHPHTTICLSNHYILIFVLFAYIPLDISRNDVLEDVFRFLCTRGENFPYQSSSFERVLWLLSVLLHKNPIISSAHPWLSGHLCLLQITLCISYFSHAVTKCEQKQLWERQGPSWAPSWRGKLGGRSHCVCRPETDTSASFCSGTPANGTVVLTFKISLSFSSLSGNTLPETPRDEPVKLTMGSERQCRREHIHPKQTNRVVDWG